MILQFVGIPLRWEYRGYMYTMWFLDMSIRWVYPSLFKYFVVFALRCWTMSYYDIVSCVYYVFFGHSLNMGLSFIVYGLK